MTMTVILSLVSYFFLEREGTKKVIIAIKDTAHCRLVTHTQVRCACTLNHTQKRAKKNRFPIPSTKSSLRNVDLDMPLCRA